MNLNSCNSESSWTPHEKCPLRTAEVVSKVHGSVGYEKYFGVLTFVWLCITSTMISATNKMQQNFVILILLKLDLHVSAHSFAYLQEHFSCVYSFLEQCTDCAVCCRQVTQIGKQQTAQSVLCFKKLYIWSKCSLRWAKLSSETCRTIFKRINKTNFVASCWLLILTRWSFVDLFTFQIYP